MKKYRFSEEVRNSLETVELDAIRKIENLSVAQRILDVELTEDNIQAIIAELN